MAMADATDVETTELERLIARLRGYAVAPRADLVEIADGIERSLAGVYDEGRTQGHIDAMRAHCPAVGDQWVLRRLGWIMAAADAAELDPSPYRKEPSHG
jgi:hypothetical protein